MLANFPAAALNDYARANDPFAKVGKQQVAVDVSSVIRASPHSFRVAWTERHYESGQLSATERWTAILTIVIQPPRDAVFDDLARELRKLGASVNEFDDGLEITPQPLHGASIATYNDHRMAMAFALAGLRVPGVVIRDPACAISCSCTRRAPATWPSTTRRSSRR